jgi:hypothetical protein
VPLAASARTFPARLALAAARETLSAPFSASLRRPAPPPPAPPPPL